MKLIKKKKKNAIKISLNFQMEKKKNSPQYIPLKFSFNFIKKFITMDLMTKATIDDLKPTFGNLLSINLFGKRLIYTYNNIVLDTDKTLEDLISEHSIKHEAILNLEVHQVEEGA